MNKKTLKKEALQTMDDVKYDTLECHTERLIVLQKRYGQLLSCILAEDSNLYTDTNVEKFFKDYFKWRRCELLKRIWAVSVHSGYGAVTGLTSLLLAAAMIYGLTNDYDGPKLSAGSYAFWSGIILGSAGISYHGGKNAYQILKTTQNLKPIYHSWEKERD